MTLLIAQTVKKKTAFPGTNEFTLQAVLGFHLPFARGIEQTGIRKLSMIQIKGATN
jgi:hypothetical protein